MHRLLVLFCFLSISAARGAEKAFHATSLGTSFAIAGDITGTYDIRSDKVRVKIKSGHLVRQPCPYTGERRVTQLSVFLGSWAKNRRGFDVFVYSAPLKIDKMIALGETIPLGAATFDIAVNGLSREQVEKSWLGFSIVNETQMDGKPRGGTCDIHTTTSLDGSPTGFPAKREKTASGELKILETALAPALDGLAPASEVSFLPEENTMQADFSAKTYQASEMSYSGGSRIAPRYERGPDEEGFMLTIQLQKAGTVNPAYKPSALEKSNWKTETGVAPVAGSQKQAYWVLSYGKQTDPALLEKFRQGWQSLSGISR